MNGTVGLAEMIVAGHTIPRQGESHSITFGCLFSPTKSSLYQRHTGVFVWLKLGSRPLNVRLLSDCWLGRMRERPVRACWSRVRQPHRRN